DDQLAAMAAARDDGLIAGGGLGNVRIDQLRHAAAVPDAPARATCSSSPSATGPPRSTDALAAASARAPSTRRRGRPAPTTAVVTACADAIGTAITKALQEAGHCSARCTAARRSPRSISQGVA